MTDAKNIARLMGIRKNLLSEIRHHISTGAVFDEGTPKAQVKVRLQELSRAYNEFETNKRELSGFCSKFKENEITVFQTTNNTIGDEFLVCKCHLEELCLEENEKESKESSNGGQFKANLQLPPMRIKMFTGKFQDWEEFRDTFKSCVDSKDSNLSDCQKLLYLKSVLEEEPFNLVKSLRANEQSYKIAWEMLEKRYHNTRRLFETHFNAILNLPVLQLESAKALKHMMDVTNGSVAAIQLITNTTDVEPFIVHILVSKLDNVTAKHWAEELKGAADLPNLDQFAQFIEMRFTVLDGMSTRETKEVAQKEYSQRATSKSFMAKQERKSRCSICAGEHRPFECTAFKQADIQQRKEMVQEKSLCGNCLYPHQTDKCQSRFRCGKCKQRHHTLLHEDIDTEEQPTDSASPSPFVGHLDTPKQSLLATAVIPVIHKNGSTINLRALIDQGSMSNIITESAVQKLGLLKHPVNVSITCIGNTEASICKFKTNLQIGSLYSSYKYNLDALIVSSITKIKPPHKLQQAQFWKHIEKLELADPAHMKPGAIDLLIGAETFAEIILDGLIKGSPGEPIAQRTKLGWILSGAVSSDNTVSIYCNFTLAEAQQLSDQIKKFWELEEDLEEKHWTKEEQEFLDKFESETQIGPDGKYIVRLPFKIPTESANFLGDSYASAKRRFEQLEKRFQKDPDLFKQYKECIENDLRLGHVREATKEEYDNCSKGYFMPQLVVLKDSSTTTKARIVFDASAKTSNGFSLNDRLMVGPVVQSDIFTVLVSWRTFEVAYAADVSQMYKQVWVHEDDVKYQMFLWRENPSKPLKILISLTLTFGTGPAAGQATLCFGKSAIEQKDRFPVVAEDLQRKTYVDDHLGGAESVAAAKQKYRNITEITSARGFVLRKWCSNSKEFLQEVPHDLQETQSQEKESNEFVIKALGIKWHIDSDTFKYTLPIFDASKAVTKRRFLSDICKLFDPLGWLSPVTVKLKIWNQILWTKGITWDQNIPKDMEKAWCELRVELKDLEDVRIPRWIRFSTEFKEFSLHAFCDASEKAYAASIYFRAIDQHSNTFCTLLAAKTRVAPLKKVSLAKLELCSAVLLSKLLKKIKLALNLSMPIFAWSDSTIALAWIASPPARWKTFVANRVAKIQQVLSAEHWHHVVSADNAADVASRGIFPGEFKEHPLWWHGPDFLRKPQNEWPLRIDSMQDTCEEEKGESLSFHTNIQPEHICHRIMDSYETLSMVVSLAVHCRRFFRKNNGTKLTTSDYDEAQNMLIKYTQSAYFPQEMESLKAKKSLNPNSKLSGFLPYLDEQGLMRVRGRLQEANLENQVKHPIILPAEGQFTNLVIREAHLKTLHGGTQVTMQYTRQKFWILRTRKTVGNHLKKCLRCHRYKNKFQTQVMGNLPAPRVNQCHVFSNSGLDFAGYFEVKSSPLRNAAYIKCYVALFVCLSTKAIHLELVESLSTEAFMQAFIRFVSRRGRPSHLFSDNGTNFVGASNELPQMLMDSTAQVTQFINKQLILDGTQWHFIPPRAPHFGGLWEAGVKSTKFHLTRILGDQRLTYVNFSTLLAQIEAVLNSRPLCPLTEDPQDLGVLTPGHFLIGREITAIPEPSLLEVADNRLSQYQSIQKLFQQFWEQWSQEYLQRLQKRTKWTQDSPNLTTGQIVLIKEDNVPPSRWLLGRVTETFPGEDGMVRVVNVRTKNSILKRPVAKLSLLPTEDNYRNILKNDSQTYFISFLDSLNSSNPASMFNPARIQ